MAMTHQMAGISSKNTLCYLLPKDIVFVTFGRFGHFVSMTFPLCNKWGQAKCFIGLWAFWAVEGGYRCLFCPLSPCPNGGDRPLSLPEHGMLWSWINWQRVCSTASFGNEPSIPSQHQPEKKQMEVIPTLWARSLWTRAASYCCILLSIFVFCAKSYSKCQVFAPVPLAFIVSLLTEGHLYTNHGIYCTNTFPNSKKKSRCVCKGLGFQLSRCFFLCWDWRDLQEKLVGPSWSTSFLKIKHDYGFISLATQQGHQQFPHQRHLGATSDTTTLLPTHHPIILQCCKKVGTTNYKQHEMQVPWVCLKMIHS